MSNKVKYGLKNAYAAKMTEDDEGNVSYDTPKSIPGAVSLSVSATGEKTSFYADDIEYYTSVQNNGYDGTMEFALIPDWFKEEIMGESVDENKVYTENANVQPAYFALLFEFDGDVKKTRHVLYKCKATRPNVEGQTKGNTTEPKTESLSITARPLADGTVKARTTETTPDSTYSGWFGAVYGISA